MPSSRRPVRAFDALPDPGSAGSLDDLVEQLRLLKVWAGDPSYEWITGRVNAGWTAAGRPAAELAGRTTVVDCFRPGRRRLNTELVVAVVQVLHPDVGYATQWRQALQVVRGRIWAAAQVRVHDRLPPDLAGFVGRTAELDRLRRALRHGGPVVVCAITGMAGVGKTQLAVHAAHVLAGEELFDRVLFVNLRGFHPDLTQLPAAPAAVLDGFLRLLGMPGHQVPHDLPTRTAAYRARLAGTRTMIVLDNAADAEQVPPLLPATEGCPVLVTSRRRLTALRASVRLTVDTFPPDDAVDFLAGATPGVPTGDDQRAAARIARRSGYLPLALGLVAGHVHGTLGWTLTDHADRLDERHHSRCLDTGVELAFDLSYRHLPADRQRMLRLVGTHPGQDLDAHAAAALAGIDLATARATLNHLCRDHLMQQTTAGRYTLHDLVRAYASVRAHDEDPPSQRRAARTRLFDHYLDAAATAVDALFSTTPVLADQDAARAWLDTERPTLVAVAAHTATYGWPAHTVRLSAVLFRYLDRGHDADALIVHTHAVNAARHDDDHPGLVTALTNLGVAQLRLGRRGTAADHLRQALALSRQAGDLAGQARAQGYLHEALALFRHAGAEGKVCVLPTPTGRASR
ncbi:tetratricopeptide repeat protein [Lentzea aerocolonigenes]|uniref:tetratricopeptide repeat protein n=1 Tax=Lentzea aerocolonigenes TaxID=68170 RepID=UPI0006970F8E|nr:tetratricopeptide repeat protein [Lentzea aerocolonigenes]